MLTHHVMAKPVKRMKKASLSRRVNCPDGFMLRLNAVINDSIDNEWSNYSDSPTEKWRISAVYPKDIVYLGKSGGACLYSFNHNGVSVAIGELFIDSDDKFEERYRELEQLQVIHGVFKRSRLEDPKTRKAVIDKYHYWIIRTTFTSFQNTAGFREALTKDGNAKHRFKTDASEDIAQLMKDLHDDYNLVWNVQGRELSLRDSFSKFKFYLDYPKHREHFKPIVANADEWKEADKFKESTISGQQIYEATKEAIQKDIERFFQYFQLKNLSGNVQ
ncbi:hypothetical protein FRC03_003683 [Tulasnella sp. 419]|nr:hypothetical protein FRC03_003683 [Tulasnella sp. 419]